jgi:N-acetylmuramoyl-L-alanine amidase
MRKSIVFLLVTCLILTGLGAFFTTTDSAETTFGQGIIKRGAVGGDVWELQGRLKFLGYYKGKIDGKFGWGTYWAVRNFQSKFGMKVDGIVGQQTKNKLFKATKNWKPTAQGRNPAKTQAAKPKTYKAHGQSENDIRIMANAVYGEARGEPYVGQVAVAAVILNRVKSPTFPNTPSGVIFEPRAFTAVADGQIWLTPNETAKKAVRDALNGWDPTGGATYYFNPDTATSAWIWGRPQIKKIGKHIFCR